MLLHCDTLQLRCSAALYCTILYCTALHCTVLYCAVLHCTALCCSVLHCSVLHCTALYCTALHCTALYCTALYCTALYCLCCTVLPNFTLLQCHTLKHSTFRSSWCQTLVPTSLSVHALKATFLAFYLVYNSSVIHHPHNPLHSIAGPLSIPLLSVTHYTYVYVSPIPVFIFSLSGPDRVHQIIGVERGRPETPSDQGTADAASVESDDPSQSGSNPVPLTALARSSSGTSSEGGVELGLISTQGPLSLGGEKAPQPTLSKSQTVTLTVPSTYVPLILPNPKSSTWCPIRANVYAEDDLILR
jgi:hypothetical protein